MTVSQRTKATMSEEALQQHIVKLLEAYARQDICWFHVPNGGSRDKRTAHLMRLAGTKPGVADLMLFIDKQSFALEIKTEIGTLSSVQLDWREIFERAGGNYFVAYGLQEAIGVLKGINAFRPHISFTTTAVDDGRGARRRPWEKKKPEAANQSPSEAGAPV